MLQLSYLEKERTYSSDSGVIYVDLPTNELISEILVDFHVNNTAPTSRDYTRTILDVPTSIDVLLEGSKTAYSCAPEVGSYLAFLGAKQVPAHLIRERGETAIRLPIRFGRFPGDMDYMLDTGNYKSAQLQIAYTLNTTYETTGTTELTVYILRPLERIGVRGFIRSRTINVYTSSGSAEVKQVDLPMGLPWLNVGFRVWDIDAFVENNVTDIDLNIDEGRMHLFQGRIEDLKRLNKGWYGSKIQANQLWALTADSQYVQHLMADPDAIFWSGYSAGIEIFNSSAIWSNRHQIGMHQDDGSAESANRDFIVQASGGFPYSAFTVGNFEDGAFNAPGHSDAFIEYTIGAYAAQFETFVQEVVEGGL